MQNYLYLTLALLFIATTYQIKPDFFTSLSNFVHDNNPKNHTENILGLLTFRFIKGNIKRCYHSMLSRL